MLKSSQFGSERAVEEGAMRRVDVEVRREQKVWRVSEGERSPTMTQGQRLEEATHRCHLHWACTAVKVHGASQTCTVSGDESMVAS